jgi:hypothetical protein
MRNGVMKWRKGNGMKVKNRGKLKTMVKHIGQPTSAKLCGFVVSADVNFLTFFRIVAHFPCGEEGITNN